MRELNKKIFEVAALTSPNEEVNISQLLTDDLVNETKLQDSSKQKKPDQEAMKIIEDERRKITTPSQAITANKDKTSTSLNLKQASLKTVSKGNIKEKQNIKSNNSLLLLILVFLIAGIAYYLYSELF